MVRIQGHREKPAGSAPGTVVYIGEQRDRPVGISEIRYTLEGCSERSSIPVEECVPPSRSDEVVWYKIDGVHDTDLLKKVGAAFGLHSLVVEDIANTQQRPKIEDFEEYIFIALKMISYDSDGESIFAEHVSLVLGKGFVISFLEDPGDVFDPLRERIRRGKGQLRKQGADYLLYALMDSIVDRYFDALEELAEDIEEVETEVVDCPSRTTLRSIHALKRELIYLRRSVWPLRESVSTLLRDGSQLVTDDTKIFLRDLYDHTIHAIDTVETLRDIVSGMLDVYLSSISNKMNEIMKVLTVMSSIFIPLTFIVGVYGMNFKYMPELESSWGYPVVWVVMVGIAVSLLVYFRRRKWI